MTNRKWISLLLSISLVFTLLQTVAPAVSAAEEDVYTSQALTINGEAAAWTVLGSRPETFGDNSSLDRFEYWDAESLDFELQHTKSGLTAGSYQLFLELFSEAASPGDQAVVYAVTSEGDWKAPIAYDGSSWEAPAELKLNGIEVGSDGIIMLGIKMVSAGEHYGYIRNVQLSETKTPALNTAVKPNSAILRPGKTVQLSVEAGSSQQVSYQTSDSAVAVVDEQGLVTAVGDGEAVITATVTEQGDAVAAGTSQIVVSSTLQSRYQLIQVEPVDELAGDARSDFMMGADISMLDALSAVDRKYYTAEGIEKPLLELLQDNGVNWVRLRAWVDPADEQGNPYGAGNVDTEGLVRMAAQAKSADMKLLVDLHYSDFWTDPGRQSIPKSWAALTADELEQQVYDYTYETLQALYAQHAYPDMIQIGNEINGGMLWPHGNSAEKAKRYIEQGIKAVRDFETAVSGGHIDIVIHRANPGDGVDRLTSFYSTYADLDYDVIGLSYYPFWHGSLDNLQQVMDKLADTFGKEIAIVETSYAYTLEDPIHNGPTGHIFGQTQADAAGYLATVQGQANAIRDVIAAVAAVPDNLGVGIFYWEPAWLMGTDTGWATSDAAAYQKEAIPVDGGSGWANQALFNYFGEALPSLNVFQAVRASRDGYIEPTITQVKELQLTTSQGINAPLPAYVTALFSDDTYRQVGVESWSPSSYDYNTPGQYELTGKLASEGVVKATIIVRPKNYVANPGLESSDMSAWQLVNAARSTDAAYEGSYAIHFWNQDHVSAKQTVTGLPNGVYELSVQTRIGVEGEPIADTSVLYATTSDTTYSTPLEVTSWDKWKKLALSDIEVRNGQLEIGVEVNDAEGDYGDFDDWELIRVGDLPGTTPNPSPHPTPGPTAPTTVTPEQVLSISQENGSTILKVAVPANQSELAIPAKELANHAGAQIVLTWGEQTVKLARDAVVEQLEAAQTGSIVIRKEANEQLKLTLNGAMVDDTLLAPVQWNVMEKTTSGQRELDVQLHITAKVLSSAPASSLGLYRVAADGKLTYMTGITVSESGVMELQLSTRQLYAAAVTRQFSDIDEQSDAIRKLVAAGLVQGDQRGALHLQQQATRAEVSKLTALLLGTVEGATINDSGVFAQTGEQQIDTQQTSTQQAKAADNGTAKSFADVPDQHWAKPYIDQLTARGWLLGINEHSFAPNTMMSHEALYVMLARILNLPLGETDVQSTIEAHAWAKPSIEAVAAAGILTQGELQGTDFTAALTREQLFELFYRLLKYTEN